MQPIIEINNLVKTFDSEAVLKGLSVSIQPGSVLGILGSNGAGKTTLIQTLLGFLSADGGTCKIFDEPSDNLSANTKHRLGYVAQESDLIDWMTVSQIIEYTKSFYTQWDDALIERLMNEWSITPEKVIDKLSLGQKQKVAILLALGHSPELLILDEPVASLDPVTRRQFIGELVEINSVHNSTIIFSTHITSDLERVAADILIMKDGRTYFYGEIDQLKERFVKLHLYSENGLPNTLNIPGQVSAIHHGKRAQVIVEDLEKVDIKQLEEELSATIDVATMSLEDIFIEAHA